MFYEHVSTIQADSKERGFGGVEVIMHPLLRYKVLVREGHRTHHHIAVWAAGITITVAYYFPAATQETEQNVLIQFAAMSVGRPVFIGGINTRHSRWGKTTNV